MAPWLAPSPCTWPGCPSLAEPGGSRCGAHASSFHQGVSGRRLPEDWEATRTRILLRDRGVCRRCGRTAAEVDHVIRGGGEHDANLQALCRPCHAAKTAAEALAARQAGDRPGTGMRR